MIPLSPDEPGPEDPWLTLAEIAEELRMSPATIRSWVSRGTLKATRPGQRKLLVRRSELDRMLRGDDYVEPEEMTSSEDAADGQPRRRRRWPDSISAPGTRTWDSTDEPVDREKFLGVSEWEWVAALQESAMAPPDAWFAGRIMHIAEAAARKANALAAFDDDTAWDWEDERTGADFVLSYELRPGGNRPGPASLWATFDAAVARLGDATADGRAGPMRGALENLSLAMHDLSDAVKELGGPYPWQEVREDSSAESEPTTDPAPRAA